MYFKQFYLGCLAHASYLIGSEGEAVVVDPQRDVDQYIREAGAAGLRIKYVVETHLHADFVSGHRELSARTGASIVFSHRAGVDFEHRAVCDGDELQIGQVTLRFLETPGHTPESISILVTDREVSNLPQKILTGDTLFIGDVGRPDLAGSKGFTAEQMAGMLYESLHEKLMKLDDSTEVYPAHGAGSMCGRNISRETSSTIGQQKSFNYALKPMGRDEFVRMMTTDLPPAPAYFPRDAEINRTGARALCELPRPTALKPEEVRKLSECGHLILDVRSAGDFGAGHIQGALNIGLGGQFASWAGTLIPMGVPLIIVADSNEVVDEAMMRLARVGLESVVGFLEGGMPAWEKAGLEVSRVEQITVNELEGRIGEQPDLQILDVRRPTEHGAGRVPGARNLQLSELESRIAELDEKRPMAVICAGGYRSSAATSILSAHGFTRLCNITGGTGAWIKAGMPVETD